MWDQVEFFFNLESQHLLVYLSFKKEEKNIQKYSRVRERNV
jgi:hypothetical protein